MFVGSRQRIATMTENMNAFINGISLNRVNCSKCLGVEIDGSSHGIPMTKYHEKDQTFPSNILTNLWLNLTLVIVVLFGMA